MWTFTTLYIFNSTVCVDVKSKMYTGLFGDFARWFFILDGNEIFLIKTLASFLHANYAYVEHEPD